MENEPSTPRDDNSDLTMWQLILYFYLPAVTLAIADSIPVPLIPAFLVDSLNEEAGWTGVVVSMAGLGGMALSVPGGIATSVCGEKPTMLGSIFVYGLTAAVAAIAGSLYTFLPATFVRVRCFGPSLIDNLVDPPS